MNKKQGLFIAIIGVVIAGAIFYVANSKSSNTIDSTSEVNKTQSADSQTKDDNPSTPSPTGSYMQYSEAEFSKTTGTRLLFFHASWCPQCRQLDASIKGADIPDNVTIFKVDYDSNQALRQKYGVTIQTTVVKVDASGNKEKLYVAYEEPTFANVKKELLD